MIELTGEPFGAGLPEDRPPWRDAVVLGLHLARDELVARLGARVRPRCGSRGLLDEVRALRPSGLGITASRAIGYAQAIAQLDGELDEPEAIEQTASLTRRLARRQVGWFRTSYRRRTWFDADDPDLVDATRASRRAAAAARMM